MWQSIEKYDQLKRKPTQCVFYFPESDTKGRNHLSETVQLVRHFGRRASTHYYEIGTPNS